MTAILANRSAIDRHATDFYPTPPAATEALRLWLLDSGLFVPGDSIWEPACGEGHIARVFEDAGHEVRSTDLFDDSFGRGGVDFLTAEDEGHDWIITNPPFKVATEFIERGIELGHPMALLVKSQFWHAAGRRELFNAHRPAAVLPLTWRPDFHFGARGGSPTMEVIWTVWSPGIGTTEYQPLARPAGF